MEKVLLIYKEIPLNKLNFHVDDVSIYLKRDDLLDLAFGENDGAIKSIEIEIEPTATK